MALLMVVAAGAGCLSWDSSVGRSRTLAAVAAVGGTAGRARRWRSGSGAKQPWNEPVTSDGSRADIATVALQRRLSTDSPSPSP